MFTKPVHLWVEEAFMPEWSVSQSDLTNKSEKMRKMFWNPWEILIQTTYRTILWLQHVINTCMQYSDIYKLLTCFLVCEGDCCAIEGNWGIWGKCTIRGEGHSWREPEKIEDKMLQCTTIQPKACKWVMYLHRMVTCRYASHVLHSNSTQRPINNII